MFIHDIIKIKYIDEGYLPNHPYRMITDYEMFDAFIKFEDTQSDSTLRYFDYNYPLIDAAFSTTKSATDIYNELKAFISDCIIDYLYNSVELPSWIYAYMLGNVLCMNSSEDDLADLKELFSMDGYAEFSNEVAQNCYKTSLAWVSKLTGTDNARPATFYGEPHVIKSLRLQAANITS